jgi:hypothetical protein
MLALLAVGLPLKKTNTCPFNEVNGISVRNSTNSILSMPGVSESNSLIKICAFDRLLMKTKNVSSSKLVSLDIFIVYIYKRK